MNPHEDKGDGTHRRCPNSNEGAAVGREGTQLESLELAFLNSPRFMPGQYGD